MAVAHSDAGCAKGLSAQSPVVDRVGNEIGLADFQVPRRQVSRGDRVVNHVPVIVFLRNDEAHSRVPNPDGSVNKCGGSAGIGGGEEGLADDKRCRLVGGESGKDSRQDQ